MRMLWPPRARPPSLGFPPLANERGTRRFADFLLDRASPPQRCAQVRPTPSSDRLNGTSNTRAGKVDTRMSRPGKRPRVGRLPRCHLVGKSWLKLRCASRLAGACMQGASGASCCEGPMRTLVRRAGHRRFHIPVVATWDPESARRPKHAEMEEAMPRKCGPVVFRAEPEKNGTRGLCRQADGKLLRARFAGGSSACPPGLVGADVVDDVAQCRTPSCTVCRKPVP